MLRGASRRSAGFNFNVEEWFEGDHYETLAICRSLDLARAALAAAVAEKPAWNQVEARRKSSRPAQPS
jgi:hypothetical protein